MRPNRTEQFGAAYGPCALVIGGSLGIGRAFAESCAKRGLEVIITGRREEQLRAAAAEISAAFGTSCTYLVCDMADHGAADWLARETAGTDLGLVVYNAADTYVGEFLAGRLDHHLRIADTNCKNLLSASYLFGSRFRDLGRGGILLMSSLSGLQGTPLVASYAASKAFIRVLGEGLWHELKPAGVDVLTCIAGATRTPGYLSSKPANSAAKVPEMEPAKVAETALDALGKMPSVIPGAVNRFAFFFMSRILSRKGAVNFIGRRMYRQYQNDGGKP